MRERQPEKPVINVWGKLVALGPVRRDLVPLYQSWINDFRTLRTLATTPRPLTLEEEERWCEDRSGEVAFSPSTPRSGCTT
jgi:hypothetical protein